MTRVKEVAKMKGLDLKEVAEKLGITYQALNSNLRTPKVAKLLDISKVLNCEIAELMECGPGYAHFYDTDTKEWLGIRKK